MARLLSLTVFALLSSAGALTHQRENPIVLGYRSPATIKKTTPTTPPYRIDSSGNVVASAAFKKFLKNSSTNSSAKGRNILSKNVSSSGQSSKNESATQQKLNATQQQQLLDSQYQQALGNMKEQWNQQIANVPVDYLQAQKQALGAAMNATEQLKLKVQAWTNQQQNQQKTESEAEKYAKLDANGTRSGNGYHYDSTIGTTEKEHWVPNQAFDGTAAWNKVMTEMKIPTFPVPNLSSKQNILPKWDPESPEYPSWKASLPTSRVAK